MVVIPEEWVVGSLSVLALTTTSQTACLCTTVDAVSRDVTSSVGSVAKTFRMFVSDHQVNKKNEKTYGVALRARR